MDVREKLVELIEKARLLANETLGSMNRGFGGWYADYLITHGVTVQEWISVNDRLPEETQAFLVVLNNEDINIRVFNSKNESWQTYSSNRVTHWMPIPQPPKGE